MTQAKHPRRTSPGRFSPSARPRGGSASPAGSTPSSTRRAVAACRVDAPPRQTSKALRGGQGQLLEVLDLGDAHSYESQGTRAVRERAVEQPARKLADPLPVGESGGECGRAAAYRKVRIAELRRHGARDLTGLRQVVRDAKRHAAELVVQ